MVYIIIIGLPDITTMNIVLVTIAIEYRRKNWGKEGIRKEKEELKWLKITL